MKYKSKNKGITLIALVITVIVMLILAGVAISAIINGDGLFNRTTQAEREHVKSSILEVVDMAELDLTIENAQTGKKIDINSLIEKIKEISSINEEDYIISVDEEEQSATIIRRKHSRRYSRCSKTNNNICIRTSSRYIWRRSKNNDNSKRRK